MAKGRAATFRLTAPILREPIIHKQIADTLRLELCPPGRISRDGVTWWSVDMAAYAGTVPGIRTARGCIAGVPDMVILYRSAAYFLELKADDGSLSPGQQVVGIAILLAGARYAIARSPLEAVQHLDAWEIPRAHRIRGL